MSGAYVELIENKMEVKITSHMFMSRSNSCSLSKAFRHGDEQQRRKEDGSCGVHLQAADANCGSERDGAVVENETRFLSF